MTICRRTALGLVPLAIAALMLCAATPVCAQTVTTDKPDYFPGEIVTITGSGWLPGETVSLLLQEDPPLNPDVSLAVVADHNGNVTNADFAVPANAGGTSYMLTATGQTSGRIALATFTDLIGLGSLCAAVAGHGVAVCPTATGATGVLGASQQGTNTHYAQQAGSTAPYHIIGATDASPASVVANAGSAQTVAPCTDGAVPVQIQSSVFGNTTVCGTLVNGIITFSWTAQAPDGGPACSTTVVTYRKCTTSTNPGGQTTTRCDWVGANNDIVADGVDNSQPDAAAGIGVVDTSGTVIEPNPQTGQCPVQQQSTATVTHIHDDSSDQDITGTTQTLRPTEANPNPTLTVHDQATITGSSFPPTGTVTFSFWGPTNDTCLGDAMAQTTIDLSTGTVSGKAVTVDATSFAQTLGAGSFSFQATYNGNSSSTGSTSTCEKLDVATTETTPTIVTQIHDASHTDITGSTPTIYYVSVHDKATVAGSVGTPTGNVTFRLFSTLDCLDLPSFSLAPAGSLTGDETVLLASGMAESTPFVPATAGTLGYQVYYAGDSVYAPVTSACEPLTLAKIQPSLVTEIHFSDGTPIPQTQTVTPGAIVHDAASAAAPVGNVAILPAPTGSVAFTFFTGGDCTTGTASPAGSAAVTGWLSSAGSGGSDTADGSSSAGPLAVGSYAFQASYPGDDNYTNAASACEPLQVSVCVPPPAVFGLRTAGNFTVLGLTGANVIISEAHTSIKGAVGLGPNDTGALLKATIDGVLRLDPSAHPDIHPDLKVTGGTVVQALSTPVAQANAASAALAALAPTQTLGNITTSTTIVRTGGTNVIAVNSVNLVKRTLTIQGGPSDVFIFNVAGGFTFGSSQMQLSGGVTANNILWNFPGSGSDVNIYKDVTVAYGIFLAPQRHIIQDHGVVTGALIGGSGGLKVDIHSAATVQCP